MNIMNKFTPPTEEELKNIIEFGKDYNPSWKHYGKRIQVTCDNCKRPTLISRGLGSRDLCINCVKMLKMQFDSSNKLLMKEPIKPESF